MRLSQNDFQKQQIKTINFWKYLKLVQSFKIMKHCCMTFENWIQRSNNILKFDIDDDWMKSYKNC